MARLCVMSGAEAAAEAMRQINPDVVPAYPITPTTVVIEQFARFVADGAVDGEMVLVESEHSALSAAVGASAAGARVMSATDAQGLVYMYEVLPIASGMRLPIVLTIANRTLNYPANIHCDHSDSMSCRDHGWIQLYSETAQEVYENTLLAVRLAEKVLLPVMVMQDGFITSGNVVKVRILDDNAAKRFVCGYKPRQSLLDFDNPIAYGLKMMDSCYETKFEINAAMEDARSAYLKIGKELERITGNRYGFVECYRLNDAQAAIVVLNATAGTAKEVADNMRRRGMKVGVLKIRMFRPFPYKEVFNALKHVKAVAILDRSESYGAYPPLYSEVVNAFVGIKTRPAMQSYVFGIGGRYIFEKDIETVFKEMLGGKVTGKVRHIGVEK